MSPCYRVAGIAFALVLTAGPAAAQYQYKYQYYTPTQTTTGPDLSDAETAQTMTDSIRVWSMWGMVGGLAGAIAYGIRFYMRMSAAKDPEAAIANDAWVQARLRGETPPPPPGLERDAHAPPPAMSYTTNLQTASLLPASASAPPPPVNSSRPWQRPDAVRTKSG